MGNFSMSEAHRFWVTLKQMYVYKEWKYGSVSKCLHCIGDALGSLPAAKGAKQWQ